MSFSKTNFLAFFRITIAVFCLTSLPATLSYAVIKDYSRSALPTSDPILTETLSLLNEGKAQEALDKVNKYIKDNPNSAIAYEIRGIAYSKTGDLEKGKAALQTALSLNPKQATAYTKLADIYLFEGNVKSAKEFLLRSVSIDPNLARSHQRLGVIFEEERQIEKAIAHYQQGLIGVSNNYLGIRLNLAFLYIKIGKPQKTLVLLGNWSDDKTSNALVHLAVGNANLALQKPQASIASFGAAVALTPKETKPLIGLGAAQRMAGYLDAAILTFRKALEIDELSATPHFQLSILLTTKGQHEDALDHMITAFSKSASPKNIEPLLAKAYANTGQKSEAVDIYKVRLAVPDPIIQDFTGLGLIYQQFDDYAEAENIYKKQIAAFSTSSNGYFRLGSLYGLQKRYSEASAIYEEGLETSPDNIPLLKGSSIANLRLGNRGRAIEFATKIVDLSPGNAGDTFYLATLYEDAEETRKAIAAYRATLSKNPNHAFAMNNLASLLVKKGEEEEALQLAKQAAKIADKNGNVQHTLGLILYRHKKFIEAITVLERASKLLPGKPVIRYDLARSYRAVGKIDRAKAELKAALAMPVTFAEAKDAKALLGKL